VDAQSERPLCPQCGETTHVILFGRFNSVYGGGPAQKYKCTKCSKAYLSPEAREMFRERRRRGQRQDLRAVYLDASDRGSLQC
jgi:hypothetical protein